MDKIKLREYEGYLDIELRLSRSTTSYRKQVHSRYFISEPCFEIFVGCFANSVGVDDVYNRYGPTQFNKAELVEVKQCLTQLNQQLAEIDTRSEMEKQLPQYLIRELEDDLNFRVQWQTLLHQLTEATVELINLVQRAIREGFTIWVLGL